MLDTLNTKEVIEFSGYQIIQLCDAISFGLSTEMWFDLK